MPEIRETDVTDTLPGGTGPRPAPPAFSAAMEARVAELVLGDRRHGLG